MSLVLALTGPWASRAQSPQALRTPHPAFAEVETAWTEFWTHIILGDLEAARGYVHSHGRHALQRPEEAEDLKDTARRLARCRLDPVPLGADVEHVRYGLRCEHASGRAERSVLLQPDWDGIWRFVGF